MNTEFDTAVLAIVKGADIKENLKRLYLSGDIDAADLAACVERCLIKLPDYNDILGT